MFRRSILLGILLILVVYIGRVIYVTFSNMDLQEFKPVCAIFLLDISASSRESLYKEQQSILKMAKRLDSEDHARIYVVSEDAYEVYDGPPNKIVAMRESMNKRSEFDPDSWGTAYGVALKKAVGDALFYKERGYKPAIVVFGDLENEGVVNKQINWNTLPKNLENTLKYVPDLTLTFMYAHPQKLDEIRQTLLPIMKDQLIFASEENVDLAIRKFTQAVGR